MAAETRLNAVHAFRRLGRAEHGRHPRGQNPENRFDQVSFISGIRNSWLIWSKRAIVKNLRQRRQGS